MAQRKTWQRVISLIIGMSIGLVAIIFVNRTLYPKEHLEAEGNPTYRLQKMITEMNSVVPLMVDENIRFDSIFINSNKLLEYKYTLVNLQKDSADVNAFEQRYKPILIHNIKIKESLEVVRSTQLTVTYRYYDKNGDLFCTINIVPEMYI